jgi:hypothetical protein
LPAADPGKDVIARWRERLCTKVASNQWRVDQAKLATAIQDAGHRCVRICEQENMGTVRGTEGTGEFERYTPAQYIEAARSVMGTIDLDPATSKHAQKTVRAKRFFTAEDDGLARDCMAAWGRASLLGKNARSAFLLSITPQPGKCAGPTRPDCAA